MRLHSTLNHITTKMQCRFQKGSEPFHFRDFVEYVNDVPLTVCRAHGKTRRILIDVVNFVRENVVILIHDSPNRSDFNVLERHSQAFDLIAAQPEHRLVRWVLKFFVEHALKPNRSIGVNHLPQHNRVGQVVPRMLYDPSNSGFLCV